MTRTIKNVDAHRWIVPIRVFSLCAISLSVAESPAWAQCEPVWSMIPHTGLASALTVFDEDGDGPTPPMLFVGGGIQDIGMERPQGGVFGVAVNNVARLDGWNWYPAGEGLGIPPVAGTVVRSLFGSDEGSHPELRGVFAGGSTFHLWNPSLRRVARWTGVEWVDVGGGADSEPRSFVLYDEPGRGPVLMAGAFYRLNNGVPEVFGVGRWDGVEWTMVGDGLWSSTPGRTGAGHAVAIFDEDGPGGKPPLLFVGGSFRYAGNVEVANFARWDGDNWSAVGGFGVPGSGVRAMCVFDDGHGPQLYVGGSFSNVGGPPGQWINAYRLARWDGKQWSEVPGWGIAGGQVLAMTVWDDDGPGPNKPALFVAGSFWNIPNIPGSWNLVKWDGERWYAMPGGVGPPGPGGYVESLQVFDEDGDGPNPGGLYVAGQFLYAGGQIANGLARWGCPLTPPCMADCDFSTGFGTLDVFDFLCFLNRFHAGAPYACDCDVSTGHGVCDIFDFLCYGQRFQAGCP